MEEIKREIKKNPRNNNENTTVKNLWDTEKSVLRGSSERLIGLRLLTTESLQPFNIKLQAEEWLV